MFNRIRYAAHVLSSSPVDPYGQPDIKFEKEQPVETTRVSRYIGGLIEVLIVSLVIGIIAAPPLARLWPARTFDLNRTTAVVAAILGMLAMHYFEKFKAAIGRRLKIGEKLAPYFGHRITRTITTLRS
jgi:hypothetical protein